MTLAEHKAKFKETLEMLDWQPMCGIDEPMEKYVFKMRDKCYTTLDQLRRRGDNDVHLNNKRKVVETIKKKRPWVSIDHSFTKFSGLTDHPFNTLEELKKRKVVIESAINRWLMYLGELPATSEMA